MRKTRAVPKKLAVERPSHLPTSGVAPPLLQILASAPISGPLGIAQIVLQTIAVIFPFLKDSSAWFKLLKKTGR
jgi:hypothetical protein